MNIVTKEKITTVNNQGIWKRFLTMLKLAKIPWIGIVIYIIANFGMIFLALLVPRVKGNFYAGDVSVSSVLTVLVSEICVNLLFMIILFTKNTVSAMIDRNFRSVLWKKILHLEAKFFDQVSSNTLLSRITDDAESLKTFVIDVVISELISYSTAAATIAAMATMDTSLAIIMAVVIPIILITTFILGRLNLKIGNLVKLKMAELTEYLSGQISKLSVIKAFNRQEEETKRGEESIENYYIAEYKTRLVELLKAIIDTIIGIIPEIAVIIIGIRLLDDRILTVAGWVAFHTYAMTLITFFKDKSNVWISIKTVQGQLNRISELLCEPEEGIASYIIEEVESGDIVFDSVEFAYEDKTVLKNISVTIPANKLTAIVGPSGTGKTTMVKLLERIYEPKSGRILIGEHELKDYNLKNWREKIAFVSQSAPLISGTIRENVLYGISKEISDEEIMEAAKKIRAENFIKKFPNGLDGQVGQFGEKLSGGQRQKLSILRAFLQDKDFIILDEPTANLDMISSYEVVQSIGRLKEYKTVVMVVHDGKLLDDTDHIIVLEDNYTAKEGTISELSKNSKFFRKLIEEEA
ncbi:MAG: ABC transporter ATP-binding protein [Intestinibacter sp.]|uniref:ABC transporter ATP-binding protein n=1 Tax=Intestinibacter sp. TaxID=1965304 RepID=UPI003F136578